MTDAKKPPEDGGEIDWDQALSEWENTSFSPEVAKDVATDKPGALAGSPRTLYRPPTAAPPVRPKPVPPRPPPKAWTPTEDDEETEATKLASLPKGLLEQGRSSQPPAPAGESDPPPPARPPVSTRPADEELGRWSPPEPAHLGAHGQPTLADPLEVAETGSLPRLVPEERQYDPNEVTESARIDMVTDVSKRISRASAEPPVAEGASDGALTLRPPVKVPIPHEARTWANERPASQWLTAETVASLRSRAEWLEQDAEAQTDKMTRARSLLRCSEIFATIGDYERAQPLAAEARDIAPSVALAHWQARTLMPTRTLDEEDQVHALDAEARLHPTPAARLHSMLLAAETLRATGKADPANERLAEAAQTLPTDVRASVALAARALTRDEPVDLSAARTEGGGTASILGALDTCIRMRGRETERPPSRGTPAPPELLLEARRKLDTGDVGAAAPLIAGLAAIPELAPAAKWLAALLAATGSAHRADAARWLQELAERGDEDARRALLALAIEMADAQRVARAIGGHGTITSAERMTLAALADLPLSATDPHLDATASTAGMDALAAALTALAMPRAGEDHDSEALARAERTVGSRDSRALVRLARLLTASAPASDIEAALSAVDEAHAAEVRAVSLEMAARAGRTTDVSRVLESWGAGWGSREEGAIGALAAALVAERAGDLPRALEAFKAARTADPTSEAALRAIASLEAVDLVAEMNELADDLGEGTRGAVARIEAVARSEGVLPEPTRADMLEHAHSAAPALPIASFLAERIARRSGDLEEVLRWVRERRAATTDAVEAGLDAVREALLVADREPQLAAERLQEAHRARPNDIALRELYERMGSESPEARASWRERRAADSSGEGRTLLLLDAAREYERAGDQEAALRCAEAAGANDGSLGGIARERAELRAKRVARLSEELVAAAKGTEDVRTRREAYERLAQLDADARHDLASALLWHRSILEETPHHLASLRHVEQHLMGEGRDEELEPIASAIAVSLRGSGGGECTAHAELAARLRLRSPDAKWESARDLADLAAGEVEPSLWSLRAQQGQARAQGDDATFLASTLRLVDRSSRPAESATLLTLAGEAASRLGRLEESRGLLERATVEDTGDVVAWTLLSEVRRHLGDHRGAAEACESVARDSLVKEQRLRAWYEAAQLWLDGAQDPDRAASAMEEVATIDLGYRDVFDRLSHLYASRRMHAALASLLERRIAAATSADERLAMEVHRGRVLLEADDPAGARRAFEAALAERPEDPGALSAFADLCVSQSDWEAAENALVQLARLLPTPDEQRRVYAQLGDLYAEHLANLPRAELALKEVLKRAPDDVEATEKLIAVYKGQNDAPRAAELQQQLLAKARSPEEKRKRVVELAAIHEQTAHDNRRAEQILEAARREFPQDVGVLRELAEFYTRHQQTPAVNILLDRAGGDARRALAAGRVSPALFEVLAAVFDLREKRDAAAISRAMLAALEGKPAQISAAGPRAFDSRLDDRLAPDVITPPLRALLAKTGDALDQASPVDLKAMRAAPLPADAPLAVLAAEIAQAMGMGSIQVLVSPKLGPTCIPVGSSPPSILVGEALPGQEPHAAFLVLRALKLVNAKASVLARTPPSDLAVLLSAWIKCFNPAWQPQGVNASLLGAASARIQAALPRSQGPEIPTIALEAAGTIGTQAGALGAQAIAWADRVALLALGDPNAAFDGIASATGTAKGAPRDTKERAAWIARSPEARDLIAFATTDAFAEVRAKLGLDR